MNITSFKIFLCLNILCCRAEVDLITFSYHRPLQLYAHLESLYQNCTGIGQVTVLWRADQEHFKQAYQEVFRKFPQIKTIQEDSSKNKSLKSLVIEHTRQSPNQHIMYGVDDIIVTRSCDLNKAVALKEKYGAYAFFLRLGKNITYTYMLNKHTGLPSKYKEQNSCIIWAFKDGQGDWAYPNSLDMAIYQKKDVMNFFDTNLFQKTNKITPNLFEGYWARQANLSLQGICFEHSVIINIPANLVNQVSTSNRHANIYSVNDLLTIFNLGKKIDISLFQNIDNNSAHEEHVFSFINR